MDDRSQRVLAIGLDGATLDVLIPLMESGHLPNLSELCSRGSWGRLRSTVPPLTAPAWSSFATGVNPGKHGVFQFFQPRGQKGPTVNFEALVNGTAIRAPTLWQILSAAELRVGLVNVPMTYPPPVVAGFVVAGMPAPLRPEIFTYPAELQDRLQGYRIDLPYFMGGREFQADYVPAAREFLADLERLMGERGRHTLRLIRTGPWDFFMVVFTETDRLGHYLWSAHPSAQGDRGGPALAGEVADWYRRLDEVLGEVVAAAGPETAILVMSDHGMGPAAERRVYFNDWLCQSGYLTLDSRRASNLNFWLRRLGLSRDRLARIFRWLPRAVVAPLVRWGSAVEMPIDYVASRAYYEPIYEFI